MGRAGSGGRWRGLAAQGHRVVIVARDAARRTAACGDLARESGNPAVELVTADLARIGGARAAAEALLRTCERLDVLVHNAGLWPSGYPPSASRGHSRPTADG